MNQSSIFILAILLFSLVGCENAPKADKQNGSKKNESLGTVEPTSTANGEIVKVPETPAPKGMVWIPEGSFIMGNNNGINRDETPEHVVALDGYWMDATEVTNAQFKAFVDATGYVTNAEGKPELRAVKGEKPKILPEYNVPGSICCKKNLNPKQFDSRIGAYNWWAYVKGANWKHPQGPGSSIKDIMDHPVVHVSWLDAVAYCQWAGKQLPTEAQWEYAARGGLEKKEYPWGDIRNPQGKWLNNIWQGEFPVSNDVKDGFRFSAPVKSFPPNGYGLYDMSGNVWEWVHDFYRADYYAKSPRKNPTGPTDSLDPDEPNIIKRVQRGGSFMCSDSYCVGYRVSARMKAEFDTGAFHQGFRCIVPASGIKTFLKAPAQKKLQNASK